MNSRISSYFFFVLLLAAAAATAFIFLPFLTPVVLAMAVAVVAHPLYRLIWRLLGRRRFMSTVAAIATVLIVVAVILVPLFFLAGSIYSEIQVLYGMLTDEGNRSHVVDALNAYSQSFSNHIFGVLPAYTFDSLNVTEYMKAGLEWAFSNLDSIFSSLAKVGGYALVFLLALFYFLRDGAALKQKFISWSPLLDANDEYITTTFKRGIRSIFAGALSASLLEGVSTGLAFLAFGIPAPALWGTVAAVAALVPGFGTSLVILPGVAYLFIIGKYAFGIGLLIWGYTGIFLIDHVLSPSLVNRGVHIHPFLILLSVLGGLLVFGVVGLFLGPVVLVFLFTLLEIYKNAFMNPDPSAGPPRI